jgi:hypothetical protein
MSGVFTISLLGYHDLFTDEMIQRLMDLIIAGDTG